MMLVLHFCYISGFQLLV